MNARTLSTVLLTGAILLLVVGLVGKAPGFLGDTSVKGISVAGLGLLAIGQAVRLRFDRRPRTVVTFLLVLALAAFILLD